MIDTHAHILPGLDDGARDMAQSLAICEACAAAGVGRAVCTPHLKYDPSVFVPSARAAWVKVREAVALEGIDLDLDLGYELDINLLVETDPAAILSCTFGSGRRVLLVETPYSGWPKWAERALFDLRLRDVVPVLAHPERNEEFQKHPERLSELVHQGIVLQVTVPSLLGHFGRGARNAALRHVTWGEVSLLASDVHHGRLRSTSLLKGADELRRLLPGYPVDVLVHENPRRLLAGEPLLRTGQVGRRDMWMAHLRKLVR